jgi:sigma-B regulation protein RsbU (phosphoserine phosphatase)
MSPHLVPAGLQLFYDLVHALNSTLDLDVVLVEVLGQVNQFLSIDATSVSFLDPESQELIIQMTIGQSMDPQPGLRLPPHAGIAGWAVHHSESVLVGDAQQDSRFYPAVDQLTGFTTRALICVPLLSKRGPVGVIQAISKRPGIFSQADLCFMVTLADVASLAIENARLYQAERDARHQAEALKRIADTISLSLNLDEVLTSALEQLQQIVPYDSAMILALDPFSPCTNPALQESGERLTVVAARGFGQLDAVLDITVLAEDVPLFRKMCARKRPIAIADAQMDDRYVALVEPDPVRAWMGVPMIVQGSIIGYVSAGRYTVEPFSSQEVQVAAAFAHQVAGAISNRRLYCDAC